MRVLVTGASGFLGRAIVSEAAGAGHHVIAASRSGTLVAGAVQVQASGDLAEGPDALDLSGVDAVINCAARVHMTGREDPAQAEAAYAAMNVQLPVSLAEAAREAGTTRFIQISSVAAVASCTAPGETLDDGAAPAPATSYGRTKLAADEALACLASDGFAVTSLRPPAIYGPGVGAFFAMLIRAAKAGMPLPVGAIRNRRSFVFVGNVANAVVGSLETIRSGSFILSDSLPISTAELYSRLIALHGHGGREAWRIWRWPEPLVRLPARLLLGDRADSLLGNAAFDGSRFAREFGWQPRVDMDEALRLTLS
ncbi:MAG: NAD-dependent epimerase/dehydratase family protein [Erythrobacter sp.]